MLKKIVVPLDGSKLAEVALPYAEELAGKMDYEVVLLSVLPSEDPQDYRRHKAYTDRVAEVTRRQAEKYFRLSSSKTIGVEAVTRTGNPAEGILDYVGRETSKMIVIATHGRSGISR